MIRRPTFGFAALGAAAALAGCGVAGDVRPVAQQPVIEVADGATARPVQFRDIVIKLRQGAPIGVAQYDSFCSYSQELLYHGDDRALDDDELSRAFARELTAANYSVVGGSESLFAAETASGADYVVAGAVVDLDADLCYPDGAPASGYDLSKSRGEARMRVAWEVFSLLDRQVVYGTTTDGYGRVAKTQFAGDVDAFLGAFAQATRNLLADRGFHALVTDAPVAAAPQPTRALTLAARPLSEQSFSSHPEDTTGSVVTLRAGGTYGSGFYIDGDGHLLTNAHVVGGAERAKIRLADGRELDGRVVARDPRRDVALVATEPPGVAGLPIRRGRAPVGADVFAVGSPLSESFSATVSRGIVSAYRIENGLAFIQSDVNVQPGNSGGPLVDADGNVTGIAVTGFFVGDATTGVNFFIPIEDALQHLGIELAAGGA